MTEVTSDAVTSSTGVTSSLETAELEDLPLVKPLNQARETGVKDEGELGLFSRGQVGTHTETSSIPLFQTSAGKSKPSSQQHGRKLLIQVVDDDDEEEEKENGTKTRDEGEGTWATAATRRFTPPGTTPHDDLIIEELDPLNSSTSERQEIAPSGGRKEEEGGWVGGASLFEEAGRVPENILHEFDTYMQRAAEKEELAEAEKVWRLAEKAGSTLEEDKVDLDEDTKIKLRERVRSTVDSSSLCF